MGRKTARQRAMRTLATNRQRVEYTGQSMSRPEEMPDGDDDWPEATDGVTDDDAVDPDLQNRVSVDEQARVNATKGWFTDGHERWDVVRDRKAFVVHMLPRLARMRGWTEDGSQ